MRKILVMYFQYEMGLLTIFII